METAAEARLAARSGAMLFAGAGLLTLVNSVASRSLGAEGTNVGVLRVFGLVSLVSAVVVWYVPWRRFPPRARLVLAGWGLVLLLGSGKWGAYAATRQAATAFPIFFALILAWLGLTQDRGVSVLFGAVVAIGSVWLTATMPRSAVPLSGLLLATASAALVGETIAFVSARNRRSSDQLRALVRSSSDLRGVLSFFEAAALAADATCRILGADHAELLPGAPKADELATTRRGSAGMTIPLIGPSGTVAIVYVEPAISDPFTDQLVQLISTEFGGRLEQLRLLEALGEQSVSDALTGVGNRRHADALTAELRPGDAVLLIDIDHFKEVNDTRGHAGGDRVLEELGAHLKNTLRRGDQVARYGGDEFLVRLDLADGDPEAIARRLLDTWIGAGAAVTFSVGVAVHASGSDAAETFAVADRALYRAKQSGRAQVQRAADTATIP